MAKAELTNGDKYISKVDAKKDIGKQKQGRPAHGKESVDMFRSHKGKAEASDCNKV